ncbi:hypothetical protein EAE96_006966 [Botrytis aclada]|nr:hypothetical protein EAE96_006966 [Botrytis aclada]
MTLPVIPKRGLNAREVAALLMMVASQVIIGIVMLRMMIANQDVNNVGFTEVFPTIPGAQCKACQINDGKNTSGNIDCSNIAKGAMMKPFKMDEGINVSEYLFRSKYIIDDRLTCHRTFVMEKKHALIEGLWEVISGVYQLEEMAAGSKTEDGSARNAEAQRVFQKGAMDGVEEDWEALKFAQDAADPAEVNKKFRAEVSKMEERVSEFRKGVEELMEKSDVEGVLNMVKKTLKGLGTNEQFAQGGKKSAGNSEEWSAKMKKAQKSKDKVTRALSGLWEIFHALDQEMKDTERWLGDTEMVLKGVVREFSREWKM